MPNNKKGSGQGQQDMGRQSQGAQGGYGNTSREAGGSKQDSGRGQGNQQDMGRGQSGQQSHQGDSRSGSKSGGMGGNDDEM